MNPRDTAPLLFPVRLLTGLETATANRHNQQERYQEQTALGELLPKFGRRSPFPNPTCQARGYLALGRYPTWKIDSPQGPTRLINETKELRRRHLLRGLRDTRLLLYRPFLPSPPNTEMIQVAAAA